MEDKEKRVFLETKLRNLRRRYIKTSSGEEAIELKCEIDSIERELNS